MKRALLLLILPIIVLAGGIEDRGGELYLNNQFLSSSLVFSSAISKQSRDEDDFKIRVDDSLNVYISKPTSKSPCSLSIYLRMSKWNFKLYPYFGSEKVSDSLVSIDAEFDGTKVITRGGTVFNEAGFDIKGVSNGEVLFDKATKKHPASYDKVMLDAIEATCLDRG